MANAASPNSRRYFDLWRLLKRTIRAKCMGFAMNS